MVGRELEEITADFRGFWRRLTRTRSCAGSGPEKGVVHLAHGAVVNAIWDLWAKARGEAASGSSSRT